MQKGIYEVISDVKIRREPHIVEGTTTNSVGLLKVGTQRAIYDTIVQSDNSTWGRLSGADSAGIALWVCIQGLNRTYLKFIKPFDDQPVPTDHESDLDLRVLHIEIFLQDKFGYKP